MSRPAHVARVVWAFWPAAGIAAVGGLVPVLLGGFSGRISGVIIPFWIAALAFAGAALLHARGRPIATGLYFVAGLAIVYGILAMVAVPLRLAVVGTCGAPPAACGVGLERPLTSGESTGMAFATGMGVVALLVGFFGLVIVFRRLPVLAARAEPVTPPVRRIPPVKAKAVESETESQPELAEGATTAEATPESTAPAEEPELPPHVEEEAPELPAPEPN